MSKKYTELENSYREAVQEKVADAKSLLDSMELKSSAPPSEWYRILNDLKQTLGNINNDISFIATLMAKLYLQEKAGLTDYDAAEKPQGAPGLDIDVILPSGKRVVAEIKTTTPYNGPDFGAAQKASFEKDFKKLAAAEADLKFMFVTEDATFKILCRPRYAEKLNGVTVVQLVSGEEK